MAHRNSIILATVLVVALTSFAGTWIAGPGSGSHGTADGPNVWYWAGTGKGDGDFNTATTSGWAPQTYAYGSTITVAQAGTCTFIALKADVSITTRTAKIALYDSSNALLANGTASVTATGLNWRTTAVNVPVTAGTYKVMVSIEANNGLIGYDTDQDGLADDVVYASFPPGTLTPSVETGFIYGVKMYVD